jgi:hypothetical protein
MKNLKLKKWTFFRVFFALLDRGRVWIAEPKMARISRLGTPTSAFESLTPKVGVGTMIAHDPLHRSGRAELPHPAPTLGEDAQAHERIRMTNTSRRKPSRNIALHAGPRQVVTLASTAQHRPPQITHGVAKSAQCRAIHGHSVIAEVAQQDRAQVRSLFPNRRVHALPQFFFQSPQLRLPPLAHRLSQYREVPLPSFPTAVGKAQKVKRFRLAATPVSV